MILRKVQDIGTPDGWVIRSSSRVFVESGAPPQKLGFCQVTWARSCSLVGLEHLRGDLVNTELVDYAGVDASDYPDESLW